MAVEQSRSRPRKSDEGGFTLIELLITLAVTVIGLAGVMSLHLAMMKGNRNAAHTAEATTIAREFMEDLRAKPLTAITTDYGTPPIVDVVLAPVFGRVGMTYVPKVSIRQLLGNLLWIRVEVVWADDGSDPSVVDEQYRHKIAFEIVRTTLEDQ